MNKPANIVLLIEDEPKIRRFLRAGFELQRLAPGVYAAIRREPAGLLEHSNSLVVIGEREVTVVDAQMTLSLIHI